jgi:hypothetical protein
MTSRRVQCPACGTLLELPAGCCDCFVRCGHCHHRFRLPKKIQVPEDAIASWLAREEEPDDLIEPQAQPPPAPAPSEAGQTMVLPAISGHDISLVKVDRQGALFEFSADRLRESHFRGAMPRRCLQCGARNHLRVHVIVYGADLGSSAALETERHLSLPALTEPNPASLTNEDLLRRLPRVPDAPEPADLPMPYWLCDMCEGAEPVSGQIYADSQTGRDQCRLLISSLRRAEEFLLAAGGRGSPAHGQLIGQMNSIRRNPWDALPLRVQHRLQQWFRCASGERFVAYVPDRSLTRKEEGMAGLVISTRRLVYHTQVRHGEIAPSEQVELELAMSGQRGTVRIRTPRWEAKHLAVDAEGIAALRRALAAAKFHASWR